MQPHFLPWAGYFNLISKSDKFIFLDDAQFSKNNWHNRNRILNEEKVSWISVPIVSGKLNKKINETEIVNTIYWKKKMIKKIYSFYSKHPFRKDVELILTKIDQYNEKSLVNLNIKLIKFISNKIGLNKVEFLNSSDLNIEKNLIRTEKIIKILQHVNASEYLTPEGSLEYLKEDKFKKRCSIKLNIRIFKIKTYKQHGSINFYDKLSILDLIANKGWRDCLEYVK